MSDLTHLKDGDPVRVFDRLAPSRTELHGGPEGGYHGVVSGPPGRRFLVIKFRKAEGGHEHEIRVGRADGQSADSGRRWTVQTMDEAEDGLRRTASLAMLRSAGLGISGAAPGRQPSTALLIALADVVDEWGQEALS